MHATASLDTRRAAIATATAAGIALAWACVQPATADLAAQVYRARLFADHGWVLWDNTWFAGHPIPGYSVLSPVVMSALGVAPAGLAAAVVTTTAAAAAARTIAPQRWLGATAWVAWAATSDLLIGRVTYALGQAAAMLCCLAILRAQPIWVTAALGAVCAALSPVAALLLVLVLGAVWTVSRSPALIAPAAAAAGVTVAGALAFSDGGTQPYAVTSALVAIGLTLACRQLIDHRHPMMRRVLALYALAVAACLVVPGPMGSNITRLGVMAVVPLLLMGQRENARHASQLLAAVACAWLLFAPVSEVVKTLHSPAGAPGYYQPLLQALPSDLDQGRLEVVPTLTRWEVVRLGTRVLLARGWETQLDQRRNRLFYAGTLTTRRYVAWLRRNAVRYVALSDAPKERWGQAEARLLARPLAALRPVWRSAHWTLFQVQGARPLVSGARVVRVAPDSIVIDVRRPGPVSMRVRWSRYLRAKGACVSRTGDGFIRLVVSARGRLELRTAFARAAGRCA